jgi:RNA polymerase sigma-70 factor (ECF subfamily)
MAEWLRKAMPTARPQTVKEFFALAGRNTRWELNVMARRLDE